MKFSVKLAFLIGVTALLLIVAGPVFAAGEGDAQDNDAANSAAQDEGTRLQTRARAIAGAGTLNERSQDVNDDDSVMASANSRIRAKADRDALSVRGGGEEKAWCPSWGWWCGSSASSNNSDEGGDEMDDEGDDEDPEQSPS